MPWNRRIPLLFLIITGVFAAGVQSLQGQRYSFKSYTQEQGLENTAISYLMQDHNGLIWIATQNGLFWYDGKSFRQVENSQEIPSKDIESLHESANGTLWIGSRTGVVRRHGNHFEKIPLNRAFEIVGAGSIASDPQNRIYVATTKGLALIEPELTISDSKVQWLSEQN